MVSSLMFKSSSPRNSNLKRKLLLLALCALSNAQAAPPTTSSTSGSGFVPIEHAQRVIWFTDSRHWQTVDGQLLICPYEATALPDKECVLDRKPAWRPVNSNKIPGYELSGIQFVTTGSSVRATTPLYSFTNQNRTKYETQLCWQTHPRNPF
jgi:hypothetical protein